MHQKFLTFLALTAFFGVSAYGAEVDFMKQIKPLFEGACVQCHNPEDAKKEGAGYDMTTKEASFAGGRGYGEEVILPGDGYDSPVYWMTTIHLEDPDDPEAMPPKKPLNEHQQQIIQDWIDQGAKWPDGVVLEEKPRVTFQSVKDLLTKGGPFSAKQIDMLNLWAEQGADWPEGVSLAGDVSVDEEALGDNLALVEAIREKILETTTESSEGDMQEYTGTIPKTGVKYDMIPIPGGEFLMGSPDDEAGRFDDEGPQHKVSVEPFWMGKFEVTWNMYEPFMITGVARNKDGSPENIPADAAPVDVVSSPTTPYTEMSFGMGTDGYPAICMTQHAANKFCQWLSAQTGHYYRLPTEAEWEYACRAGTTGPFSVSEEELADYAVMDPEQIRVGYEKVGTKKPNPFGLYDMHGNVMEWVLDMYVEDAYGKRSGVSAGPLEVPTALYPRVARGGSWYDPPEELRSARRIFSDENWKVQDPQLPKSIWYHTDAHWLGFRIVRPLNVPEPEKMVLMWNLGRLGAE
ncbi:MAG: formylglycine-generating enzyme family protein [Verrucomicrobiota bacterium]